MATCYYDPVPPRAWSRVQNPCVFFDELNDINTDYNEVRRLEEERKQIQKGNVLQYKKNSSNLTKNQRYSQIAKGLWTNRTRTWATQSDTYTNPNMTSLKRVNYQTLPTPTTGVNPASLLPCPNPVVFKDGGNLLCNIYENPCTGETIPNKVETLEAKIPFSVHLSSESDVPGPIVPLLWDERIQPWYPRQRLQMTNSSNKWPVNYKLLVSAVRFKP
jgi:hypothetical protein